MIKIVIVLGVFIAALAVGLIGMGLMRLLLPKHIREKIEQFHEN